MWKIKTRQSPSEQIVRAFVSFADFSVILKPTISSDSFAT
jgi:hypothetical protein